jgi:hypothetical protein
MMTSLMIVNGYCVDNRCTHEIVTSDIFSRRQAGAARVRERQRARRDALDAQHGRLGFGRRRVLHQEIIQQQPHVATSNGNDAADNESSPITASTSRARGNISNAEYWRSVRHGRDPTHDRVHREYQHTLLHQVSQRTPCHVHHDNNNDNATKGDDNDDDIYGATRAQVNVANGVTVTGRPYSHREYWHAKKHPSSVIPTASTTGTPTPLP